MVIQNTALELKAGTAAYSFSANSASYTGWGDLIDSKALSNTASTTPLATDSLQENRRTAADDAEKTHNTGAALLQTFMLEEMYSDGRYHPKIVENDDAPYTGNQKIEYNSLKNLLGIMSNRDLGNSKKITTYDLFELLLGNFRERLNSIIPGRSSRMNTNTGNQMLGYTDKNQNALPAQWVQENYSLYSCTCEHEEMTYTTTGTVVTEDGRRINIDVEAVMSRSFVEYTELEIDYTNYKMIDPLVINLDGCPASFSDERFFFDIDMDGEEDNISMLAKGCGYLALDRNEDGKINDGSELFGAASGDGFSELAVFDMDQNGWIDENDEVFNRLRIWTKDEDGSDRLVALGVAGIGAIYLGSAAGEFTYKSQTDNSVQGKVVSTGIFLKENGQAGLVQQIDVAAC